MDIITRQINAIDNLSMRITKRRQHMTKYWSDSLRSPAESPSCHNGFPLDLEDHKNKMESPPIFSVRKLLILFVYLYLGLQLEEVRGMSRLINKKRRLLQHTLVYSTLFVI